MTRTRLAVIAAIMRRNRIVRRPSAADCNDFLRGGRGGRQSGEVETEGWLSSSVAARDETLQAATAASRRIRRTRDKNQEQTVTAE